MKVSIITTTLNSSKTIQRTIDSVVGQDYVDIEHIIIDGGSVDGTYDIIKANASRIAKYMSEKDDGIYYALNKGIKLATGDVIGFLNSDDVFTNKFVISRIVNCFNIKKTDVVYGNLVYQSDIENSKRIIRYWKSNVFNPDYLYYGWMPPHPTLYCRKSVYENYGLYKESFRISADYEFILRVFKEPGLSKSFLPIIMVNMELGGVSNKSLKNIIQKMVEDYKAIRINNIGGILTVIFKNIRKVNQFNTLRNSSDLFR